MLKVAGTIRPIFLALAIAALSCCAQAQTKPSSIAVGASSVGNPTHDMNHDGGTISPELARRIEVLIRAKSDVPYSYVFHIGPLGKSDFAGYDSVTVEFSTNGKMSKPLVFLLSKDRQTLAQLNQYDISKDPKTTVSGAGRPARGGTDNAPVLIVVFDDLECPFCSKMNAQLFPAVLDRYKGQVRIVYRDFPLDQHPWAMRAAIDTNCVGAQSGTGYWNLIDYIHVHANEIGGTEKTVARANEMLDGLAHDEGKKQGVDDAKLTSCLAKQDAAAIQQSMKEAEALGVTATPALFVNGEKLEGAQPLEYLYSMIDGALVAAGQTPPAPAQTVTPSSATQPPATQAKPGN